MKRSAIPLLLFVLAFLLACGPEASPEAASDNNGLPLPTIAATTAPSTFAAVTVSAPATIAGADAASTTAPTSTAELTAAAPAGAPGEVVYGRNDNGTFFYGAASAPLTLTDYSDFL